MTRTRARGRRIVIAAFACALVFTTSVTACSDDDRTADSTTTAPSTPASSSTTEATTTAATTTTVPLDAIKLRLMNVGSFREPTNLVTRPNDTVAYLTEKAGRVVTLQDPDRIVLDLRSDVVNAGEQGLLGLAFSPDGTKLYVDYTARGNGETRIEEFTMRSDGTADPGSRRRLLTIAQPQPNHNGGQLAFGPDGMLYIGMGDGGAGDDAGAGHAEGGNGQSTSSLLGKVLRIDPTPSADRPYSIPAGNPFANGGGRPEIWAIGLRNPWRFSFDRATGDLWIGDVGQNQWEEIDFMPAGRGAAANYGWNRYEGTHRYRGADVADTVKPIAEYSHDHGCSVTGGYVARGAAVPALVGTYLYSDYCESTLRLLRREADGSIAHRTIGFDELSTAVSFGEDAAGNVYVLSGGGGVFRILAA